MQLIWYVYLEPEDKKGYKNLGKMYSYIAQCS